MLRVVVALVVVVGLGALAWTLWGDTASAGVVGIFGALWAGDRTAKANAARERALEAADRARDDEQRRLEAAAVAAELERADIEARARADAERDPVDLVNERAARGLL